MGFAVQGNNSYFVKKVLQNKELSAKFRLWLRASKEERKKFQFKQYKNGEVEIIIKGEVKPRVSSPAI